MRLLVFALLCLPTAAAAQIVNVQARFAEAPEEGVHGASELALDWRTGSNELFTIKGSVTAHWRSDPALLLALVQGEFGRSAGLRTMSRTLEHIRYRHALTQKWSAEAFVQHEYDAFRRLVFRALVGVGPRFQFVSEKGGALAAGVSIMFDREELSTGDFPDTGRTAGEARFSSYIIARLRLATGINLVETLYFQPRANRPADWRLLEEAALVVQPSTRISLSLGFITTIDRASPAGVAPVDTQLKSAIGVGF